MVEEKSPLAQKYDNLSVAEQHSVDLALSLFNNEKYATLLHCLCPDDFELQRFRQVLINAVVTTDIFDKDLKALREARWNETYGEGCQRLDAKRVLDRKATIIIELIIQVSDVSHTMQHWHVYQKWNKRLFQEMCDAYDGGRLSKHPAEGWYRGELWFFDNYILPLASKMRQCKVFGVSCDELLHNARENRQEWVGKGQAIVADWVSERQVVQKDG